MKRRGVTVIRQRHDFDCGVAALAMLLDVPYGDVAQATRKIYGTTKPTKRGLGLYHLEAVSASLGRPLRRLYRGDKYLVGQTGILGLNGGKMNWAGHWVILKSGSTGGMIIVDPDGGETWDALDYWKTHKARPATLLVEDS